MRPRPKRYRGYRLHVDLRGEDLPKMGRNTIRVDVLKKDNKLVFPIVISDVELVVEYLPGRNGLRPGEGRARIGRSYHPGAALWRKVQGSRHLSGVILEIWVSPHFSPGGAIMAQEFFPQRVLASEGRSGDYVSSEHVAR